LEKMFIELRELLNQRQSLHAERLSEIERNSENVPQSLYDSLNYLAGEVNALEEVINKEYSFKNRNDIDLFCDSRINEIAIQEQNQKTDSYDEYEDFDFLRGARSAYERILKM
jgi:hypothetical protein